MDAYETILELYKKLYPLMKESNKNVLLEWDSETLDTYYKWRFADYFNEWIKKNPDNQLRYDVLVASIKKSIQEMTADLTNQEVVEEKPAEPVVARLKQVVKKKVMPAPLKPVTGFPIGIIIAGLGVSIPLLYFAFRRK